jgi:two-component system NtrC family sensor kinase
MKIAALTQQIAALHAHLATLDQDTDTAAPAGEATAQHVCQQLQQMLADLAAPEYCQGEQCEHTARLEATIQDLQREMSERQCTEQELVRARDELATLNSVLIRRRNLMRAIVDSLDDGLLLLDSADIIQEVNLALAALLDSNPQALVGHHWPTLAQASGFPGDVVARDGAAPRHNERRRYHHPDGTTRVLDLQTIAIAGPQQAPEQVVLHVVDATEMLRLQTMVIENERFAASGRLAASVAHEINTPLQAIQNSLALLELNTDQQQADFLVYAQQEIQRVGRIVHQLLDLYRPGSATPGPVSLHLLIERIALLLGKRLRDQGVLLVRNLATNSVPTRGYVDELLQVLLNLVVNALDAMPEGGTLRIETAIESQSSARGQQVRIAISDTGEGITPEMQARIFDAFVTTKAHGTGLGLAISSQIIQQHGGSITVDSQPGKGSAFTIRLPLLAGNAEATEQEGDV